MLITKEHCEQHRPVILRNGETQELTEFNNSTGCLYPVFSRDYNWTEDGRHNLEEDGENEMDIVAFADETEAQTFNRVNFDKHKEPDEIAIDLNDIRDNPLAFPVDINDEVRGETHGGMTLADKFAGDYISSGRECTYKDAYDWAEELLRERKRRGLR